MVEPSDGMGSADFLRALEARIASTVQASVAQMQDNLQRHSRELLEAELATAKAQFSREVQALVNALGARIAAVEASVPVAAAQPSQAPAEAPRAVGAGSPTVGDRAIQTMDIVSSILRVIREEGMPLLEGWERTRAARGYSAMLADPNLVAEFRARNPVAAFILGQQLAPDNNVAALQAQIPLLLSQGILTGVRANALARQAVQGGALSPTPGGGLPGASGVPSSVPSASPAPSAPGRPGASMETPSGSSSGRESVPSPTGPVPPDGGQGSVRLGLLEALRG